VQFTPKARFLAGASIAFCAEAQGLRRVYFLGAEAGEVPLFTAMSPAEALIELVKHSFLLDIEKPEALARHFEALSGLANQPLFYRLDYPRRFTDLPRVRQAIIEHAGKAL
jgi:hypothetical protein